jgi:hypothetical protein
MLIVQHNPYQKLESIFLSVGIVDRHYKKNLEVTINYFSSNESS